MRHFALKKMWLQKYHALTKHSVTMPYTR